MQCTPQLHKALALVFPPFPLVKGKTAKRQLGLQPIEFPRYSPDLNPLDFSLWWEIEERVARKAPAGRETVEGFKRRLRMTALRLPTDVLRKALLAVRSRAKAVVSAKGDSIPRD